jgi:asparagine synthase (glutamine-hydrolysing)
MCGISGKVYFSRSEIKKSDLALMTSKLSHRGPDATGYFINEKRNLGFGHNRLSIIDLSKKGNQPMSYLDRYTITFNGEIYNYQSLREELIQQGYKFNSKTDTEVILALYSKYKEKCLNFLRGMFAFAIYDNHDETLFLARDRVGKKPFKYYFDENVFIFASELKAILTQSEVKKEIDNIAVQKYFLYGYVPSPLTGFKNIKKLEPGHYIKINIKRHEFVNKKYWQVSFKEKLKLSEKEWSKKILETLSESTKLRMISDVPIGAFLSGGVDSSAVVAMMALNSKEKIKTFTVTYKNKKWSEEKYANLIVKKYKTDHTEILAKPEDFSKLSEIALAYEEPFSDNSGLVSFMVCNEANKHVKVVLNGDGGDELFAGYPNRYNRLKRDVDLNFLINIINKFPFRTGVKKFDNFIKKSKQPIYQKFAGYNRIFETSDYKLEKNIFDNFRGEDLKDAGLMFDQKYFLPDLLLTKMDIATMYHSIEARSPILDHNMIELANKIPFELKVKGGESKYIFKKALEPIVPKENLYREKMGFTISLEDWFKGDLTKYFKSIVNSKSQINNFVDLSKIDLNDHHKKWNILMFELWLKSYF